jgi:hypothetical protein
MSYYVKKSWKYAKSFWPWRSSSSTVSTVPPKKEEADDDFVIIKHNDSADDGNVSVGEISAEKDAKVDSLSPQRELQQKTNVTDTDMWAPFFVPEPVSLIDLRATYEMMSELPSKHDINYENFTEQLKKMKKTFNYFCQHRDELFTEFTGLYMALQDLLLSYALFSGIFLREEFEYLYGYNLDDVCNRRVVILPLDPLPNYCDDKTEFMETIDKILNVMHSINERKAMEVMYIQLFNYVCNNIRMTQRCHVLLESILERLVQFEKEKNFSLPVQKSILLKLKKD